MILFTFFAPLVTLVGLLVYALASGAKLTEIGRIMFAMGLLATLLLMGHSHPMAFP